MLVLVKKEYKKVDYDVLNSNLFILMFQYSLFI